MYLKGRPGAGPTFREAVLVHASRAAGALSGDHEHPGVLVKLGIEGAQVALRAGANDLGGTLMNESISSAAGAGHGQELPPERMEAAIRAMGRRPRQRRPCTDAGRGADAPLLRGAAARRAGQPVRQ